mmetsp:Transcript_2350/g.3578  ORF Transcript_2350/g.3578 Transcript_2350/m.3578 type:complete len:668 (+) Transcript_2350:1284-3287(+)
MESLSQQSSATMETGTIAMAVQIHVALWLMPLRSEGSVSVCFPNLSKHLTLQKPSATIFVSRRQLLSLPQHHHHQQKQHQPPLLNNYFVRSSPPIPLKRSISLISDPTPHVGDSSQSISPPPPPQRLSKSVSQPAAAASSSSSSRRRYSMAEPPPTHTHYVAFIPDPQPVLTRSTIPPHLSHMERPQSSVFTRTIESNGQVYPSEYTTLSPLRMHDEPSKRIPLTGNNGVPSVNNVQSRNALNNCYSLSSSLHRDPSSHLGLFPDNASPSMRPPHQSRNVISFSPQQRYDPSIGIVFPRPEYSPPRHSASGLSPRGRSVSCTPPPHSTSRMSPRNSASRTSLRHSASYVPTRHSATHASPRHSESQASPQHSASRTSPRCSASRTSPRRSASRMSLEQSASLMSPRHSASQASPPHSASRVSPRHSASRTSPRHSASRMSPQHSASLTSLQRSASRMSPEQPASHKSPQQHFALHNSPQHHSASLMSPQHFASQSSPRHPASITPPRHSASRTSPPHSLSSTSQRNSSQHAASRSPPHHHSLLSSSSSSPPHTQQQHPMPSPDACGDRHVIPSINGTSNHGSTNMMAPPPSNQRAVQVNSHPSSLTSSVTSFAPELPSPSHESEYRPLRSTSYRDRPSDQDYGSAAHVKLGLVDPREDGPIGVHYRE